MTQAWPQELREKLEQHKDELTRRIDKIKADVTGGLEADSKEQAAQLENQEVLDALANEGEAEIKKINAALQRMETGSYGVCVACGDSIDNARLEVRPYSSRCIGCASQPAA